MKARILAVVCGVMVLAGVQGICCLAGKPAAEWTLSEPAGEAFTEYRKTNTGQFFLTWPKSCLKKWSPFEIPGSARKEAVAWIKKVLHEDVVPEDITEHLVAMRLNFQKKYVGVPGGVQAPPPREIDTIWARYEAKSLRIQVCEHQRGMAVLVEPAGDNHPGPTGWIGAAQYILETYRRTFKTPRDALQHLNLYITRSGNDGAFYCGVMRLDPNKDFERGPETRRYWHDLIYVVIDGAKVGFTFLKHEGDPDEAFVNPRPAPPSGLRW